MSQTEKALRMGLLYLEHVAGSDGASVSLAEFVTERNRQSIEEYDEPDFQVTAEEAARGVGIILEMAWHPN